MAVITLGSSTGPVVIGGDQTIATGSVITTLPMVSPISIVGSGNNADSYWNMSGAKLVPENLSYKVGLGTVDTDTVTSNYFLLYDTAVNELKKIDAAEVELKADTRAWSTITSKPTTLAGYGITDSLQPLDADLTAISGLGFTSAANLRKTAANTWTLDTTAYSEVGHTHAEYDYVLPKATTNLLGGIKVGAYLTIDANGVLNGQAGGSGGGGVWGSITGTLSNQTDITTALGLKAPIDSPTFTTSYGFSAWRFFPSGTDLLFKYSGTNKATLGSTGTITFVGDVIAYG